MTARLGLAAPEAAADTGTATGADRREPELGAFLGRLLRWDKAAVVRLRSAEGEPVLGVFGHPPFGGVLAVKSVALTGEGAAVAVDATVSAGQLLDAVVRQAADGGEFALPGSVTGPAWAGLLPPREGWRREALLDAAAVRQAASAVVAEFRARTEALPPEQRTRAELDALAEELWSRPLPAAAWAGSGPGSDPGSGTDFGPGSGSGLTLRIVHAAHALGFLRAPARADAPAGDGEFAVLTAGPWVRLRTGYGSVAARTASAASGLTFSPRRPS